MVSHFPLLPLTHKAIQSPTSSFLTKSLLTRDPVCLTISSASIDFDSSTSSYRHVTTWCTFFFPLKPSFRWIVVWGAHFGRSKSDLTDRKRCSYPLSSLPRDFGVSFRLGNPNLALVAQWHFSYWEINGSVLQGHGRLWALVLICRV